MAHPIGFAQANTILQPPEGTPPGEVKTLEVFRNGSVCISRWQLSDAEIAELKANGGKIYLVVMGTTQPPVSLGVITPFG